MRGFIIATAWALSLATLLVVILSLIAQPEPVTLFPVTSKGLFLDRTHHCIDQTCAVELAKSMIVEQPKRSTGHTADHPCHLGAQTFPHRRWE